MSLSLIHLAKSGLALLQREIDFYRYWPSAAALEVTWVCNLKCVMCGFGRVHHRTQGELTLNEWKKVLDGLVHLGVR
jgi:MoaA/NifB/PqqE/SkfB family radical SAM enzyme